MVTFPCPWCDRTVVASPLAESTGRIRCDDCATVVDLAPEPPPEVSAADRLPLAA